MGLNSKINLTLTNRDLQGAPLKIKLKMIISGPGIQMITSAGANLNPIILENGLPTVLTSAGLAPYFNLNNIDFSEISLKRFLEIQNFCQKNKIPFYIIDNYKIALKVKAQGIFISSGNKRMIPNLFLYKKFKIIGSAHNQLEYFFKKKQQCETITLSPIFFNPKYSKNKALNPIKFNLISKDWNANLCALGGILDENIRKINLTKIIFNPED
jgi:thiamine-phosphate pyrophosphorylase